MSKFYGALQGNRGIATRCGTNDISASVQSYAGSISTRLYENAGHELCVEVSSAQGSANFNSWESKTIYFGTVKKFEEILKNYLQTNNSAI